MKKTLLLTFLFTIILLCTIMLFAMSVSAEVVGGDCGAEGDNVKWSLDTETGILEIAGSGEMASGSPWSAHNASVQTVRIGEGVTSIGNYAFYWYGSLVSVDMPSSLRQIGSSAFYGCNALKIANYPNSKANWNKNVKVAGNNLPLTNVLHTPEHAYGKWEKHDDKQHKMVCLCGDTIYAEHAFSGRWQKYDDAQHTQPCVCGFGLYGYHSYSEWKQHGIMQHKKGCECGDIVYENHEFEAGVCLDDSTHKQACKKCYDALIAEHEYGDWVSQDAESHAKDCTICNDEAIVQPHMWSNGTTTKAPTVDAEGETLYFCYDCKATKTEAIAKLPEPTEEGFFDQLGCQSTLVGSAGVMIAVSLAGVCLISKKRED